MNKSHLACLLGGAAITAGYFLFTRHKTQQQPTEQKAIDYDSEEYQHIKQEQLARIIKYFGDNKFKKL